MDDIKIDNEIIEKNNKLKKLDDRIDQKKEILKKYKDVEYGIGELNKSVNYCLDLLNKSIRGEQAQKILDVSGDINISSTKKMMNELDSNRASIQKEVKRIEVEKESIRTRKE